MEKASIPLTIHDEMFTPNYDSHSHIPVLKNSKYIDEPDRLVRGCRLKVSERVGVELAE